MTDLRFSQVDSFADRPFAGNPAAVIPLETWPDDALLQSIARENNLSETAFVVPADGIDADYELRWFTPTTEVALCGHATLAAGHVMLGDDLARERVRFVTRSAGILTVARNDGRYAMDLPAYAATPRDLPDVAAALGGAPARMLRHDAGYVIAVYEDAAAIRALNPDYRALGPIGDTLFIATAPGTDTDVVSRVFAPSAGVNEDPVTGSAHAVLAPYWTERLGRPSFSAWQASARGGRLDCTLAGDRVTLVGGCVTVIEGVMRI